MKRRYLAVAAMLVLVTGSQAGEGGSYSMTQVTTDPSGKEQGTTKWFIAPEKTRTEMPASEDGPIGGMVVITRKDKGVMWTVFPSQKAYIERPLDEEEGRAGQFMKDLKASQTVEDLGKDEILGNDCTKQKISGTIEIGPRRIETENLVWKCKGFDVPLRVKTADGAVTDTTSVEVGPQPDDLFELPADYRKAANFMELMGGMR